MRTLIRLRLLPIARAQSVIHSELRMDGDVQAHHSIDALAGRSMVGQVSLLDSGD